MSKPQLTNPTNEQELDEILDFIENYGVSASCDGFDPHKSRNEAKQAIQAHANAEIAKVLDRINAELDRHAKSTGLWGMKGLVLDTLARTGDLSIEQKIERDAMVTERRALAILYGVITAERAKLKEEK